MWILIISFAVCIRMMFADSEQNSFLKIMPENYNKYEPPWSKDNPAHVYVKLNIMDVDTIDEGNMDFHIQTYLLEFWSDNRLNLSHFTESEDTDFTFPSSLAKRIWVPDLIFDNTKSGMIFPLSVPNSFIKVRKDGLFHRTTRYNLLVGCHMNFQFYPMDTQYCIMKVSTLANPDTKLLLHWTEEMDPQMTSITLVANIQPLKYVLESPMTHKTTEKWTSGNYTYLFANFTFVRRLSGTVFNVYIPSLLVVFLSWISFWLDIAAVPARITLGVTSLLTLATQIIQAKSDLPTISYLTAVDIWLLACLLMVFSSLIEFAFAYQLFVISKKKAERDLGLKADTIVKKDIKLLYSRQKENFLGAKDDSSAGEAGRRYEPALDNICRKLFPFAFGLFAAIYWSYFLYNR